MIGAKGAVGQRWYIVPSQSLIVTRLGDHSADSGTTFDKVRWLRIGATAPNKSEA